MHRLLTAASLVLFCLPGLASAQQRLHPEAAAMCRASCLEVGMARLGADRARTVQACDIRCNAAMAHLRREGDARPPRPQRVSHRATPPAPRPVAQPAILRAAPRHGVIYGARAPSAGFGLVVGEADRMAAHRQAEQRCAAGGPGCRVLAEFTAACGAAAHGVRRSQWALFMTSDPASYVITSLSAGSGATQAQAEQQALAECRARDRSATCRIAAAACTGRG